MSELEKDKMLENQISADLEDEEKAVIAEVILESGEDIQTYYNEIKNELMRYKDVKSVSYVIVESFKTTGVFAKFRIKNKKLHVYLKIDPASLRDLGYVAYCQDVGHRNSFEDVPCEIRISDRKAMRQCKVLIRLMMKGLGIKKNYNYRKVDYIELLEKELYEEEEN